MQGFENFTPPAELNEAEKEREQALIDGLVQTIEDKINKLETAAESDDAINDKIVGLKLAKAELQNPKLHAELHETIISVMNGWEALSEQTISNEELRTEIAETMIESAQSITELRKILPRLAFVLDNTKYDQAYYELKSIEEDLDSIKEFEEGVQHTLCRGITDRFGLRSKVLDLLRNRP